MPKPYEISKLRASLRLDGNTKKYNYMLRLVIFIHAGGMPKANTKAPVILFGQLTLLFVYLLHLIFEYDFRKHPGIPAEMDHPYH